MENLDEQHLKKSLALVVLINHMDSIKKCKNINTSILNEISIDNKTILKEISKINKKLKQKT